MTTITRYTVPQPHDSKQRWCVVHRTVLAVALVLADGYARPLCEDCVKTLDRCPGVGKRPLRVVVQPQGGRGNRNGRGVCPHPECRRTLALNADGHLVGHKPGIASTR